MDYIKREDAILAIDALFVKIDANSSIAIPHYDHGIADAFNTIKNLPSADVEEVIRCKDCKYFNLNKWDKVNDIPLIVAHEICDFWGEGCKTDKDGYCSFAERRG